MTPAAEGLSRSEPSFRTAPLVGRFDLRPTLSLPLLLRGWSVRPELVLRETFYTQQLVPSSGGVGVAESDVINRKAVEGSIEIRPACPGAGLRPRTLGAQMEARH